MKKEAFACTVPQVFPELSTFQSYSKHPLLGHKTDDGAELGNIHIVLCHGELHALEPLVHCQNICWL